MSFGLLCASACTPQELCRAIAIGASIEEMDRAEVDGSSGFLYTAMMVPASRAPFGTTSGLVWDQGPAEASMCCSTQESGKTLSWCTEVQLQCADASVQGVKLYLLRKPFSDPTVIGGASYCFIAARNDRVIAIWHRFWS